MRSFFSVHFSKHLFFTFYTICFSVFNTRTFDFALDLGCGRGHIARNVLRDVVGSLHQTDMAELVLVINSLTSLSL